MMPTLPDPSDLQISFRNYTSLTLNLSFPTFHPQRLDSSFTSGSGSGRSEYLIPGGTREVRVGETKRGWGGKKVRFGITCCDSTGKVEESLTSLKNEVEIVIKKRVRRAVVEVGEGKKVLVYHQRVSKRDCRVSIYMESNLKDWMSLLPDNRNLSTLYLPGTHESLAIHGFPISSCQTFPILSQLEQGMRFLDLRFSLKDGVLLGYHGIQNQFITAEIALEFVYEFLENHKRETIVVSVKQENGKPFFEEKVWELINKRREMWYTEDRWPSLGEVRGKAVMFCRFGFSSGQGLHTFYWPDNQPEVWETDLGQKPLLVQDWYSIGSFLKIPEKASLVLSLFHPSSSSSSSPIPPRLNFCSGATLITAFPFLVAKGVGVPPVVGVKGVNERVLEALVKMGSEGKGEEEGGMILLLDYYEVPGGGCLNELMVAWNFVR